MPGKLPLQIKSIRLKVQSFKKCRSLLFQLPQFQKLTQSTKLPGTWYTILIYFTEPTTHPHTLNIKH